MPALNAKDGEVCLPRRFAFTCRMRQGGNEKRTAHLQEAALIRARMTGMAR